jgi:hypothetical protein
MPKPRINKPLHAGISLEPQQVAEKIKEYDKPGKPPKEPKAPKQPKQKFSFFDPDNLLPKEGDSCFTCPTVLKKGNYNVMVFDNGTLFGCCQECKPRHIRLSEVYNK